jgi:hypothetical protein
MVNFCEIEEGSADLIKDVVQGCVPIRFDVENT